MAWTIQREETKDPRPVDKINVVKARTLLLEIWRKAKHYVSSFSFYVLLCQQIWTVIETNWNEKVWLEQQEKERYSRDSVQYSFNPWWLEAIYVSCVRWKKQLGVERHVWNAEVRLSPRSKDSKTGQIDR